MKLYKDVKLGDNGFVGMEKDIIKLWKDKDIIKKNFDMNKDSGNVFTFYDGPPTANGTPHAGHILTRVIKDVMPRYRVMKGDYVIRKAGWDTHGLPVELEIEKKFNMSGKKDIEEFGVAKFVEECKSSVFKYVNLWEEMTEKVGFWVDMKDPYITYKNEYIESVWWALKELWNKGLLYEGHKVMPYCPRCGTSLSSHEVSQGYKDVMDLTAVVKFKFKDEDKYALAWTTTPWTLPANVALTVNKNFEYAEVEYDIKDSEGNVETTETYVIALKLADKVLGEGNYRVVNTFKGSDLVGKKYEQLMPFVEVEGKSFEVIEADFVNLSDGTGIVHTAPAFGEDDSLACKLFGLGFVNPVNERGEFIDDVEPWAGRNVKTTDKEIVKYLKEKGQLISSERVEHSYPHCWRCDTPLLYYPKKSWFVEMSNLRDDLVRNNNKVNWHPESIGKGRFGNFLENVIDWGISRDRYWGTPLPIWKCTNPKCYHLECIGSTEEMNEKAIDNFEGVELHKPYIDEVKLECPKCKSEMVREEEVIDCWFDSGSMPFAQWHYPFENKELFKSQFPAQFISEAIDQTRGWFYTLTAIGTALFERSPFENVVVLGHVLDGKGRKMSKSKGNGIDPLELLDKVGADATRWYFFSGAQPWVSSRLSYENVEETQRTFLSTLWNTYSFYTLYANLDNFDPTKYENKEPVHVMDKWILSKLNTLIKGVDENLNDYKINEAASMLSDFVGQLSNWYVRRNRKRYWAAGMEEDKISAYMTLYTVLKNLSILLAPFVPFVSEEIYQNLVVRVDKEMPESVHLNLWPEYNEELVDLELEKEMSDAYTIVSLGRNARNISDIKNRQPLSDMLVSVEDLPKYYTDIIKDELNIKNIELNADMDKYVHYEVLPNLPILGRLYGNLIPKIRAEIKAKDQNELARELRAGKEVMLDIDGTEIALSKENTLITMNGKEGYAFSTSGTIGVLLNTNITEELREEGYIRELLSTIQNTRKSNGYEVLDRINVYLNVDDEMKEIIKKFESQVMRSTLCANISYVDKEEVEAGKLDDVKINDKEIKLLLEKV